MHLQKEIVFCDRKEGSGTTFKAAQRQAYGAIGIRTDMCR